jgi:hypothetical protein
MICQQGGLRFQRLPGANQSKYAASTKAKSRGRQGRAPDLVIFLQISRGIAGRHDAQRHAYPADSDGAI